MQIKKTKFKGLKIVTNKIYKDSRGYFKEDFKQTLFKGSKFIYSCTFSNYVFHETPLVSLLFGWNKELHNLLFPF